MLSSRRKRAEELFQVAVDLEPEARSKFLDEQCGTDTALSGEVEDLLRAHEHVVELLQVGGDERIGFLDPVTVSGATEPAASEIREPAKLDEIRSRLYQAALGRSPERPKLDARRSRWTHAESRSPTASRSPAASSASRSGCP